MQANTPNPAGQKQLSSPGCGNSITIPTSGLASARARSSSPLNGISSTAREGQARRSKSNVGIRKGKKRRHHDDEEVNPWDAHLISPAKSSSRHRAKNPEVTLCTVLAEIFQEVRKHTEPIHAPFYSSVSSKVVKDYYTIVQNPMNMGEIQKKTQNLGYRSRQEFLDDFRLISSNCMLYNGHLSPLYQDASDIRDYAIKRCVDRDGELKPPEELLGTYVEPLEGIDEMECDTKAVALARIKLKGSLLKELAAGPATTQPSQPGCKLQMVNKYNAKCAAQNAQQPQTAQRPTMQSVRGACSMHRCFWRLPMIRAAH